MDDIEIIIVDDCSNGDCKSIVDQYSNKDINLSYFKHKINKGLFSARLTGMKMARGEYVVNLDPDDTITSCIYRIIYNKAQETSSDLVLFNAIQVNENKKEWIEKNNILKSFTKKSGIEILNIIFESNSKDWIWHVIWNKLIHKNIITEVIALFKTDYHLVMYEDLLFSTAIFLVIGEKKTCSSVDTFGINYLRHENAITQVDDEKTNEKKLNDVCKLYNEIERLLKHHNYFEKFKNSFYSTIALLSHNHIYGVSNNYKIQNSKIIDKLTNIIYKYYSNSANNVLNEHDIRKFVSDISNKIMNDNVTELMIYGTGDLSAKLKDNFERNNIHVKKFIVTNTYNVECFEGIPVISIKKAVNEECSTIVIASLGSIKVIKRIISDHYKINNIKYTTYSITL